MEKKPLILRGMFAFAASNIRLTIKARKALLISPTSELSEPIIIMAQNIRLADWILKHSLSSETANTPEECIITHKILDSKTSAEYRPLTRLVTPGRAGYPDYFYN